MWMIAMQTGVAYGIAIVGGAIVAVIGIPVIAYCLWLCSRLEARRPARGGVLALIGLIAAVLWSIGLVAFFCYADAHLN